MILEDALSLIASSDVSDWNVIPCWAANTGPSFLDRLQTWWGPDDGWGLDVDQHAIRAAYKPDLSLGLAFGLDFRPEYRGEPDSRNLTFDWAEDFPDSDVAGYWLDVLWCGMLVYRDLLLSVDGGRALLPSPRGFYVPTGAARAEHVGDTVTEREVAIARLVHSFEHTEKEFQGYLDRAGFVVVPD